MIIIYYEYGRVNVCIDSIIFAPSPGVVSISNIEY